MNGGRERCSRFCHARLVLWDQSKIGVADTLPVPTQRNRIGKRLPGRSEESVRSPGRIDMAQERERHPPAPQQAVDYHSYLLRLRQVTEGEQTVRQFYVREIPSLKEFYFKSLDELVAYLRAEGRLSPEREG